MNPSALAIAATTATLQGVLNEGLGGINITVRPLDTARNNTAGDQINLFLYQVLPDAAWRNLDIPRRVRPGETAQPPLPLTLYYLITAFGGDNDSDIKSHALLGKAMSVLHDYPVIGADKIKKTIDNETANLQDQVERIRITLQPLTFEEMSKLWTTFQTHYRTSAAYQVSVVLIESTRAPRAPLPVLQRGEEDRGAEVVTGSSPSLDEIRIPLRGAFDSLADVRLAQTLPGAQLNDEIALIGRYFSGGGALVRLRHPLITTPFELQPVRTDDETIIVKLPDAASASATRPAGFYIASVIVSRPGAHDRSSNEQVLPLAPAITIAPASAPAGNITLTVTAAPQVRLEQRASLLFGDREAQPKPRANAADPLVFDLGAVTAGNYVVRLRVDGVDSIPVDRASQIPKFADPQTLKVT